MKKKYMSLMVFLVLLICFLISLVGAAIYGSDYILAEKSYDEVAKYVQESEESGNSLKYDIDWDALRAINPEIVAWIIIPGTEVNYPVVQTTDNEKYLKKTFTGEKNSCGCIFMDCYNHGDFSDLNTIIYGHNMRNGSMFHILNLFREQEYYSEHREIWICTPQWQKQYQVISAHLTKSDSDTYMIAFAKGQYEKFVGREVSQSIYDTENGYRTDLECVTLSTCNGRNTNRRMVLVCQAVFEIRIAS